MSCGGLTAALGHAIRVAAVHIDGIALTGLTCFAVDGIVPGARWSDALPYPVAIGICFGTSVWAQYFLRAATFFPKSRNRNVESQNAGGGRRPGT